MTTLQTYLYGMVRRSSKSPPNPRFYLSGGFINLRFSYEGTRLSMSTGEHIEQEDWDDKKQRPKSSLRGRQDLVKIREVLDKWEKAVTDVYRKFGRDLNPNQFRTEILFATGAEERPGAAPKHLLTYLKEFTEARKKAPGKTRTSWGKFESLHNHLTAYGKEVGKEVDFDNVDWDFLDGFTKYLYRAPRSFAINNVAKLISTLKQVMRDAYRRKAHGNQIHDDRAFTVRTVKTQTKIRLTVQEIYKIEHYDFTDRPTYDQVRDLLVFACWTGLRVSDWYKIGRANFREKPEGTYIEVATTKTKTQVLIPVVPQVQTVFDKYDYSLPSISEQHFNRLVKDVCREVLPESRFTRIYSVGGIRKTEQAFKHEFISSHAGRRSFASNFFEEVKSAYAIMQITGHDSEKSFFTYIDLERDKVAATLRAPALKLASWQP